MSSFLWASLGPVRPSIEAGELIMVYNRKTKSSIVAPAMKRMGFAIAMVVMVYVIVRWLRCRALSAYFLGCQRSLAGNKYGARE